MVNDSRSCDGKRVISMSVVVVVSTAIVGNCRLPSQLDSLDHWLKAKTSKVHINF